MSWIEENSHTWGWIRKTMAYFIKHKIIVINVVINYGKHTGTNIWHAQPLIDGAISDVCSHYHVAIWMHVFTSDLNRIKIMNTSMLYAIIYNLCKQWLMMRIHLKMSLLSISKSIFHVCKWVHILVGWEWSKSWWSSKYGIAWLMQEHRASTIVNLWNCKMWKSE
jgi:hypothetical protein